MKNQITRMVWLAPVLLSLSGCSLIGFGGGGTELPKINDFPHEALKFQMSGTIESNREATMKVLSDNVVRFREKSENDETTVLTTYFEEPQVGKKSKRMRKIAYKIQILPHSENDECAEASVTWIVQSKAPKEEMWMTTPEDEFYQPVSLNIVKDLYSAHPCSEVADESELNAEKN